MTIRELELSVLLITAAVLVTVLAAACGGGGPEELEIPVKVEEEQLNPETIKVKQGDIVTLKIQVEEAGEFHLHGYDIEKDIESGEVVDFFFVADATGRFRITFHGEETNAGSEGEHKEKEEKTIGFLEVQPR